MSLNRLSNDQASRFVNRSTLSLVSMARFRSISAELEPVYGAVHRIVEEWAPLFTPPLKGEVVFTIQPGRGGSLGWFCPGRWQRKDTGRSLPEINICADHLAGNVLGVAETVVHELTHYANWLQGVNDCSASQYHKRSFKEKAESVGLECLPWDKSKGWAYTTFSAEAQARLERLGIHPNVFSLFRPRPDRVRKGTKAPKLRRWDCGNTTALCRPVWRAAGTELQAICLACGQEFRECELNPRVEV